LDALQVYTANVIVDLVAWIAMQKRK